MNHWTHRFRRKVDVALVCRKANTAKQIDMPGEGRPYTRCRTNKSFLTHFSLGKN